MSFIKIDDDISINRDHVHIMSIDENDRGFILEFYDLKGDLIESIAYESQKEAREALNMFTFMRDNVVKLRDMDVEQQSKKDIFILARRIGCPETTTEAVRWENIDRFSINHGREVYQEYDVDYSDIYIIDKSGITYHFDKTYHCKELCHIYPIELIMEMINKGEKCIYCLEPCKHEIDFNSKKPKTNEAS